MEINCPQCNQVLVPPSTRLVQDSCGHKKCRMCLLQDESQCRLCYESNAELSVIKYESNHTAVITCNKSIDCNNTGSQAVTSKQNSLTELTEDVGLNKHKDSQQCSKGSATKNSKPQIIDEKRTYKFITIPSHITISAENPALYKCTICNKTFRTKSHVKYHSYCAGDKKPLHCKDCNKDFISKYHLDTHFLGHTNKTVYTCDVCNKSFRRYGILNRHKRIHSDSRQYVCQQCGKTFKSKDYLQRHNLIHENEKPFCCSQCKAKFNNRSNLNKHRLTHSKEKIHMCDECGKRFTFKGALTVHRRSHTRLRPHKCTVCSKTFINAKELHRHKLIHIDVKAYSCCVCGVNFKRKDNLQRHIRNTHPGKKAALLKRPAKRVQTKRTLHETPTENPNAINVITAPPITAVVGSKPETVLSKPVSVINAPLKLAFKTSAFKNHYNIHSREYIEPARIHPKPYDYAESVSICQKILAPSSPPTTRTIIKTLGKVSEKDSTEICQKILSPMIPPINNDPLYEKTHSIRNIKFKLPSKYINVSKKNIFNDIGSLNPVDDPISENLLHNPNNTYTELKLMPPTNVATSVIVNGQSNCQNEMHWRRRALQNLEMQSKNQ